MKQEPRRELKRGDTTLGDGTTVLNFPSRWVYDWQHGLLKLQYVDKEEV